MFENEDLKKLVDADLKKLSDLIKLPVEVILTVQKSLSMFGIEYSEYVFLDIGVIGDIYNRMKDAIVSSPTTDDCITKLSNVIDLYSVLTPLKLFVMQKKDEIHKILEEEQPAKIESMLRATRARVPHYEVTVASIALTAASIISGAVAPSMLEAVSVKITSLISERRIRENFTNSIIALFSDLSRGHISPNECLERFTVILKMYSESTSHLRTRKSVDISEESKNWLKEISKKLNPTPEVIKELNKLGIDLNLNDYMKNTAL